MSARRWMLTILGGGALGLAAVAMDVPAQAQVRAPGEVFQDCPGACPQMVVIPPGRFVMGSPPDEAGRYEDEGPQRTVTITRPFAVGRYEITFDEWDACVAEYGCATRGHDQWKGRGRRPAVDISWNAAQQYVAWLSFKTGHAYRLMSEAEWEYAARAGTTTAYHSGMTADPEAANILATGQRQSLPVGQFPPNAFGLYDMDGNVMEFLQDCWNERFIGAPTDGSAWLAGDCGRRVRRGGYWSGYNRTAARSYNEVRGTHGVVGFRIARDI